MNRSPARRLAAAGTFFAQSPKEIDKLPDFHYNEHSSIWRCVP